MAAIKFVKAKHYHKGRISKIRLIVIHDMEMKETLTTAEACARMFATTTRSASCHYSVDNNTVVQSVKDSDTAWAAPGANSDGLQFEHAGYASQSRRDWTDAYSRAMLARSAKLTAKLALKYKIQPVHITDRQLAGNSTGFVSHAQVSRVFKQSTHTDPGPSFPWDAYMLMVRTEYNALKGKKITRKALGAAAVAMGLTASVFAATTATDTPTPKPSPTSRPNPTLTPPKATSKPTPKPTRAPTKPAVKTPRLLKFPGKNLKTGTRGASVKALQVRLRVLGAKNLPATGLFAKLTKAAVMSFQRTHGLEVDGVVGPATWKKIAPRA
jgi:N-acetyl-anhydromuramyl-L-alanine amidase AmpD